MDKMTTAASNNRYPMKDITSQSNIALSLIQALWTSTFINRFEPIACTGAVGLALASGLASGGAMAQIPDPAAIKDPIPFPTGYDFPTSAKTLESFVTNRDEAAVRRHGWHLWAGINQPGRDGWPIWRSWYIATQAFAPDLIRQTKGGSASATSGGEASATPTSTRSMKIHSLKNNPILNLNVPFYLIPDAVRKKHQKALKNILEASNIPDGENFQNNGDLMLVSEAYSLEGYNNIRERKLYEQTTLNSLQAAGKTDIEPMDYRTIVLKHMYWPVKHHGLTALPVADMKRYDIPAVPDTTYIGFENMARWTQAVAIDPSRTSIPPGTKASVKYLHDVLESNQKTPLGPHTYEKAKVVPLRDFYYKKLSAKDYSALSPYDKVLLDASFYWVHGRLFEPGDYVVAVASHIITKEMPSWTLQTLWWHDDPDHGPYARNRPAIPNAKGPWQHYLMTSEYGITANPQSNALPIAYNPYIELASHPVVTNCRNCHIRALSPGGNYIQSPGPNALDNIQLNDPIFKNLLRTDFLWSIPDRAIPTP